MQGSTDPRMAKLSSYPKFSANKNGDTNLDGPHLFAQQSKDPDDSANRRPRKRRAIEQEALADSLSTPPTFGLRQRPSETMTPSTSETRATRLARRAKPTPGIEKLRRFPSNAIADSSDEQSDAESEPHSEDLRETPDKGLTFTKEYVTAHPQESFYHAGNGWYKRGERARKSSKRYSDVLAPSFTKERTKSASQNLDYTRSYYKDDLDQFPGMEFHHCGNGYYRAGPDPAGRRISRTIPVEDETIVGAGTVDKAYKDAHPEEEWVHRGAGRYVRRDNGEKTQLEPDDSVTPAPSIKKEVDQRTYEKHYAVSHGMENFRHVGGGRYRRTQPMAESEDEQPGALYDKAHVDAHPHLEFHHRGQGRYARGPRSSMTTTAVTARAKQEEREREIESEEAEAAPEPDANVLFDSAHVSKHPLETFWHKGQGRWARGLPPPGTHNKIAVRGPGAEEWLANRKSQSDNPPPKEDPALKGLPKPTEFVTREEGPDKFPTVKWNYRGGGKWARLSKQEADAKGLLTYRGKLAMQSKAKRQAKMRRGPGPQATEEGSDAGGAEDGSLINNDGFLSTHLNPETNPSGATATVQPKKRGRKKGQLGADRNGGGERTGPGKKATPPEPVKMMTEEEDVLTAKDLVNVYNTSSMKDDQSLEPLEQLYRKTFYPINAGAMHNALTKHPVAARPLSVLEKLAEHYTRQLANLQDEYLAIERQIAPHSKVPRKPAKGGREPIDPVIFEDKKEADLYDYQYDPRKLGEQDPLAQKIVRDAEGRELRKRRQRGGIEAAETAPGWHFGEGPTVAGTKRQSRQPSRFESVVEPPRKRARPAPVEAKAASLTPDRAATPGGAPAGGFQGSFVGDKYVPASTGRWRGHVPKRVRELRDDSVPLPAAPAANTTPTATAAPTATATATATATTTATASATAAASATPEGKPRKGRPPGSKNLHKRSDAGIKKGPRKKKATDGDFTMAEEAGAGASMGLDGTRDDSAAPADTPGPREEQQREAPAPTMRPGKEVFGDPLRYYLSS